MSIFFTYRKHTYCTYLFIYLEIICQTIVFLSFRSLNRLLNTLCGNKFYWRQKIYKIFLKHPEISVACHIYKMLLEQCSNMNKTKRRLVSYLQFYKPEILFTENKKWLNMRNLAKIKKILTSVFEILPMNFRSVSPCCFFNIYKHCPQSNVFC